MWQHHKIKKKTMKFIQVDLCIMSMSISLNIDSIFEVIQKFSNISFNLCKVVRVIRFWFFHVEMEWSCYDYTYVSSMYVKILWIFFQKYIFFNSLLMGIDLMFFFSNIFLWPSHKKIYVCSLTKLCQKKFGQYMWTKKPPENISLQVHFTINFFELLYGPRKLNNNHPLI
jgi:hypothetical protein